MKKIITSRIFSFILGAMIFSGVTVFAYSISSKDIAFTPTNENWKVTNVEEAINDLYEKDNTLNYEYNGMTISIDENTHKPVYTYEGKSIVPIYWYGMIPDASYLGTPYFSGWYEKNASASLKYNDTSFNVVTSNSVSSYCYAGMTTKYSFDLTNYKKYHMIINTSTAGGTLQYVPKTGSLGTDWESNEKNYIANFSITDNEQHLVADISSVSGTYYLGLTTYCHSGTVNIAAIWLEK